MCGRPHPLPRRETLRSSQAAWPTSHQATPLGSPLQARGRNAVVVLRPVGVLVPDHELRPRHDAARARQRRVTRAGPAARRCARRPPCPHALVHLTKSASSSPTRRSSGTYCTSTHPHRRQAPAPDVSGRASGRTVDPWPSWTADGPGHRAAPPRKGEEPAAAVVGSATCPPAPRARIVPLRPPAANRCERTCTNGGARPR